LHEARRQQFNILALTQGVEIGTGWSKKGETSGKDYVSLSLAAPEFGPKKLYANLGRAAGSDEETSTL
jgi:uncharacterized protein (DUF736 family)